jgi:NodT family efflux transporter outer membrane factor (OMF) lipoprotein
MTAIPRLATFAAVLLATGCAVRGPDPVPAPSPPAQWQAPLPHEGAVGGLATWWAQFQDPLLVELVESAQQASPTVASARSRIVQARAARVGADATLVPAVDALASAQRGNSQPPLPLATTLEAGLQTSWEIDLFGGNRAAAQAARHRQDSAQAGWDDARVSVAAEAANAYFELRTCERLRAVADNDAASRAETARLADLSERAGFTAPSNAALARASAADGAQRARQQRARCELDVKALVALTALPEPVLREKLAAAWAGPPPALDVGLDAVPAQVLSQRPDLYQAEQEVAAASADVGSARAQRFPRLTLTGSIVAGEIRAGEATTRGQLWTIGPLTLDLPLYDAGRRAANVDAAQARYEEAAALYAARARQAVREVEEALVNLEAARSRVDDAQSAVENYRASFVGTEALWRGGLGSLVDLEDARRTLLAAQVTLVSVQYERLSAWVALYRAAGGGWTRS